MGNLENLTPFAAIAMQSMGVDGSDLLLVVVAGRFDVPVAGTRSAQPPKPSEVQPPVRVQDVYWDAPDASSLRYEGQTAPFRPATDVYLNGHAWAPRGRATKRVDVGLAIGGRVQKTMAVFGERAWTAGAGPSTPVPFISMPLTYERAFGGRSPNQADTPEFEPRNPVGRGYYRNMYEAANRPLPNLEDPFHLIRSPIDRPNPACFGPIARSWQPRVSQAGTYDVNWVEEQIPCWPADFDVQFFQAASPGLAIRPYLTGGEPTVLSGVSPDGNYQFSIPSYRVALKSYFQKRSARRLMNMDSVLFEPDDQSLTLTWRIALPLPAGMFEHQYSVVRILEPWEEVPG